MKREHSRNVNMMPTVFDGQLLSVPATIMCNHANVVQLQVVVRLTVGSARIATSTSEMEKKSN